MSNKRDIYRWVLGVECAQDFSLHSHNAINLRRCRRNARMPYEASVLLKKREADGGAKNFRFQFGMRIGENPRFFGGQPLPHCGCRRIDSCPVPREGCDAYENRVCQPRTMCRLQTMPNGMCGRTLPKQGALSGRFRRTAATPSRSCRPGFVSGYIISQQMPSL